MFDPRFPWIAVGFLTLVASGALIYYGAVISGLYKDPLMAHFRMYGPERRYFPFCRFLDVLGTWSLMVSSMLDALPLRSRAQWVYAPAIFLAFALMAFAGTLVARQKPFLRELLPGWYFDLLHTATRQERRHIAYAWLRIPGKMRWRLNGDQASFRVWADMVRITVFYGARDPDDPWTTGD